MDSSSFPLEQHYLFPLLFFAVVGTVGIVIAVSAMALAHIRGIREKRMASALVQEMLDRNMTADEIAKILIAWNATSREDAENLIEDLDSHAGPKPGKPPLKQAV